jgi:hypothetical protein
MQCCRWLIGKRAFQVAASRVWNSLRLRRRWSSNDVWRLNHSSNHLKSHHDVYPDTVSDRHATQLILTSSFLRHIVLVRFALLGSLCPCAKCLATPRGSSKTTEDIRAMLVSFDRSHRMLINGLNVDDVKGHLRGQTGQSFTYPRRCASLSNYFDLLFLLLSTFTQVVSWETTCTFSQVEFSTTFFWWKLKSK